MSNMIMLKKLVITILIFAAVTVITPVGSAKSTMLESSNGERDVDEDGTLYTQSIYLPVITLRKSIRGRLSTRRINAPFFDVANVTNEKFSEMAIAWFGQVTSTLNYVDIRVGFNNDALYVNLEVYDRLLWYDKTPMKDDINNWDSATLYISLDGNNGTIPNQQAYRFDAQLNWWEERDGYQAAYRGNGVDWELINASFYTQSGWRGNAPNDDVDDRGWVITFRIPFTEVLGLSGHPAYGKIWGMGIILHDRDDSAGTSIEDQSWPENVNEDNPVTWGQLHFGLPRFSPPSVEPTGSITIRHKLNGAVVQDAAVGGTTTNLCPGDSDFIWNMWGKMNFAGATDFNIQNQEDVADWPCFAKYYITFPLDKIPPGVEIISGLVRLFQWSNSGDINNPDPEKRPKPSMIQVLSVDENWDENRISWNNAPMGIENSSQAWAYPIENFPGWPGIAREWDVSYAVQQAYQANKSLGLAFYEADADYHSGKYFVSSDTGDWNEVGRPSLIVTWGVP